MSVQVKRRRDSAANIANFTPAQGEIIVDLTNNRMIVGDGVTKGGFAAAKLSEVVTSTRTTVVDTNYAVLTSDRTIAFTALTTTRVLALPSSSLYPAGVRLTILDESGAASANASITIVAAGTDMIDGAPTCRISSAYGFIGLHNSGTGNWTIVDRATSDLSAVGIGVAVDPNLPLSVYGEAALFNGQSFNISINKSSTANVASVIFENGFSGRAQIGLTGDDSFHCKVSPDGSHWIDALNINPVTGALTLNVGLAAGGWSNFRNRLRNSAFQINQRSVSGVVVLAPGAYGHDGVKAGVNGATYTFATTGIDATLTITVGSLILPIEDALIEGGTYVLAQDGTAQARVWQGTGVSGSGTFSSAQRSAGGLSVSGLVANMQTNVEFSIGTLLRPQLESGGVATSFERRPPSIELQLCQRYFQSSYPVGVAPGTPNAPIALFTYIPGSIGVPDFMAIVSCPLGTVMRATPTGVVYSPNSGAAGKVYANNQNKDINAYFDLTPSVMAIQISGNSGLVACGGVQSHYTLSAEI